MKKLGQELAPWIIILAIYGLPITAFYLFAERAETTGHTDIVKGEAWDAVNPHDNYSVFRKGRYIYMFTLLAPAKIQEIDGKLMRIDHLVARGLLVRFYRPANEKEQALWRKYFS